ncbi:MAG: dihydroorotate dehydrogenase-like protein [Verrucomicrobia bacterium]|nr:dihydroorotate dehydrogenase-like protein [Verrucomicrobiota bacterium]
MNLKTSYLGFTLSSPFVASASPMTGKIDKLRALEDAGAAAVVLPSVFEEQLRQEQEAMDRLLTNSADSLAEAQSFFPEADLYERNSDRSLELVRQAREALDIPVIASLNGISPEGWTQFARDLAGAGAQAIELNLYHVGCAPEISGADLEHQHLDVVRAVREAVDLPLAVKLSPWFSSLAHFANQLQSAGADALVLFNRFYQPDLDPETLTAGKTLQLSDSTDLLLPLSWIAILRPQLQAQLAHTGGVHTPEDAVKALMAGADVVMTTAALLKNGPQHLQTLRDGLIEWMQTHDYASLDQLRSSMSREKLPNPAIFERLNYMKLLKTAEW